MHCRRTGTACTAPATSPPTLPPLARAFAPLGADTVQVPTPACPRWLFSRACDSGLACARPAPRRGKRPATPVLVTTVPGSDETAKSSQRASRSGVQRRGRFGVQRSGDSKTCPSKISNPCRFKPVPITGRLGTFCFLFHGSTPAFCRVLRHGYDRAFGSVLFGFAEL